MDINGLLVMLHIPAQLQDTSHATCASFGMNEKDFPCETAEPLADCFKKQKEYLDAWKEEEGGAIMKII
jgi:hypothetical protein